MAVTIAVVLPFFPIAVAPIAMMVSVIVFLIWSVLSLTIVWPLARIVLSLIVVSLIIVLSLVRSAEQAANCTRSTTDASADRAANCATHRPRRAMTLVRALVGTALHAAEDALRMRLMRYGV